MNYPKTDDRQSAVIALTGATATAAPRGDLENLEAEMEAEVLISTLSRSGRCVLITWADWQSPYFR
jgi:hypothetical protein